MSDVRVAEATHPFAYLEPRIHGALSQVLDPEIRRPITQLGMVSAIEVDDAGRARVTIRLTIATCPNSTRIAEDVRATTAGVAGVTGVEVIVDVMSPAEREELVTRLRGEAATRGIPFGPGSPTRVFAVASGKGGVGKSTITANLAVALAESGLAVGVIDADVFGFSMPGLLGLVETSAEGTSVAARPTRVDGMILPPIGYGVKTISIGMFIDDNSAAVAWRGPMLHRTIKQFLTDVHFDRLDVLLLDLPPGTGDIAISLGQMLPNAEIIVVTTPQPAAADVAERSGTVARQTGQRVFGVIENMAGFVQQDGSVLDVFGAGGGATLCARLSRAQGSAVPLLASVPLSVALRSGGDAGVPIVHSQPADPAAAAIRSAAAAIAASVRDGAAHGG
ncbi:P-loop NTPase [Microbacterium sp. STN6]|uniref:P-loop NTPase n=1 Tax=Microbacterium sp. STN6 TaxID=2995588 RepID=UPI002260DFEA|nr:P-loop NTPase [Microbacterium sp. STN6]MCX7520974.1 P-loop NTPase [Microbacterium sp. STN6]